MACYDIGYNNQCRDNNTGSVVDCGAAVCSDPDKIGNYGSPVSFSDSLNVIPDPTFVTSTFGNSTEQLEGLQAIMVQWARQVCQLPGSLGGQDFKSAALDYAHQRCWEVGGPDCSDADIQAAVAAAITGFQQCSQQVVKYGTTPGYAPDPRTTQLVYDPVAGYRTVAIQNPDPTPTIPAFTTQTNTAAVVAATGTNNIGTATGTGPSVGGTNSNGIPQYQPGYQQPAAKSDGISQQTMLILGGMLVLVLLLRK
jgi:hypothetical protein